MTQELKQQLHENVMIVKFTKKDGTERTMKCTLNSDYLPKVESVETTRTKKENPDVLAVWDLEALGWRSFRLDSIISAEISK